MAEGVLLHLQLVDSVVDNFGHFYPELVAKRDMISEIIRQILHPSYLIALSLCFLFCQLHSHAPMSCKPAMSDSWGLGGELR